MESITFLMVSYNNGGIARVMTFIANGLRKNGHPVTILSIFPSKNRELFPLNPSIKKEYLLNDSMKWEKNIKVLHRCLEKYLVNNRPDVFIIADMGLIPYVYRPLLKYRPRKLIGWEHNNHTIGHKIGLYNWGRRISCRKFDASVVLSKRDKSFYLQKEKKINCLRQIYNPIDESVHIQSDLISKRIISCGRLSNQKGFDYAIQIGKTIFDKYPDWRWDIYGEGEAKEKLLRLIQKNNLENNIFLQGFSQNIYAEMLTSSIYVLPSRFEGFVMTLLEAQQCGLPVVSFDCNCGPDEIIVDQVNGFVVPCFCIDKMADDILKLMEDYELRKRFQKNSTITHTDKTPEYVVGQWEDLLSEL